jgi:hypothetical protein
MGFYSRTHQRRLGRRGSLALIAAGACVTAIVIPQLDAQAITPGLTGYQIVAGSPVSVAANSAGTAVTAGASCGTGKRIISGGVLSHSATTYIASSYPSSDTGWTVTATPTVNASYPETVTAYAVCANSSSLPGYNQVSTADKPVGPSTYYGPNLDVSDAYCASGDYVVGGGFSSPDPLTFATIERPTTDDRAWEVEVHRTSLPLVGTSTYKVYSICLPVADISSYTVVNNTSSDSTTTLTTTSPTNTAGSPFCGSGTLAVGGGGVNDDQQNGYLSSISPDASGKYWLVTDTDSAAPSYDAHIYPVAICVTATMTLPTHLSDLTGTIAGPFSAKLTSQGAPLSGKTVVFTTGFGPGKVTLCSGVTGSNGVVTCHLPTNLKTLEIRIFALTANHYIFTAHFSGDSGYKPTSATSDVFAPRPPVNWN